VRDVLLLYDKVVMGGFEGDTFLDGLATHYRDLLVCRDPATLALQEHSEELKERYQKQAALMTAAYIFSALNLINVCDIAYPQVRNKRLHVEIALSRICFLRRLQEGNPFALEKKTADPNVTSDLTLQPETKLPKHKTTPESIPSIPEVASKANGAKTISKTEDLPESPVKQQQEASPAPKRQVTPVTAQVSPATGAVVLDTPQLGSLFDLKTHVERTEKIAKDNSLELTETNALSWWNAFRQSLSSPSVSVAFKEASVHLEGKILKIVVDSILARTRIQEESELLLSFRSAFHDQALEIDIVVEESDEAREARKPKKILTVREKYEMLLSKNPAMEDLKNKLGLIVDHDE
jgi:DNA polymerase-3 subunit gamma/tau